MKFRKKTFLFFYNDQLKKKHELSFAQGKIAELKYYDSTLSYNVIMIRLAA